MSNDERSKRPKLERTQPIRAWSGLFGGATTPQTPATPAGSRTAGAPASGTSLNDVVARSVDLGYRVVEEYIRQGQKAAARFGGGSFTPEAAATDVQDAAARMAQQASDFMTMWAEFMGVAAWGGMGRMGGLGNGPAAATPPPPEPSPERRSDAPAIPIDRGSMRLEVLSRRPTEVQLDLRTQATGTLVVQGVRAVDPDKPKLADVTLRPAIRDEPPTVRVVVPDEQPSGVYRGLIVEEGTSRLVGTLTVRIVDENGTA